MRLQSTETTEPYTLVGSVVSNILTSNLLSFGVSSCSVISKLIAPLLLLFIILLLPYHIMRLHSFLLSFSVTLTFVPLDHWALVSSRNREGGGGGGNSSSSNSSYHRSKVSPVSSSSFVSSGNTYSNSNSSHQLVRRKRKYLCPSLADVLQKTRMTLIVGVLVVFIANFTSPNTHTHTHTHLTQWLHLLLR